MPRARVGGPLHVFVDESKRDGRFMLAAVAVSANHVARARAELLRVRGSAARLHFTSASNARRTRLLAALDTHATGVWIIEGPPAAGEIPARRECVAALVEASLETGVRRLVIERDETRVRDDQRTIHDVLRASGRAEYFVFEHATVREDLMLALADAAAWCWTRGGPWRAKLPQAVIQRTRL